MFFKQLVEVEVNNVCLVYHYRFIARICVIVPNVYEDESDEDANKYTIYIDGHFCLVVLLSAIVRKQNV